MRPRGKPPTPSARSTAIEPVEITSIFSSAAAPSFMIEPFPNCFSICRIAWSIARVFSDTATSHLLIAPQKGRRRLASRRRHQFRWGVLGGGEAPGPHQFSFSLRLGFTISKVIGWTVCATDFLRSSFSSCSFDFFLAFLSLASPRPVGIVPSRAPRWSARGTSSIADGRPPSPTSARANARILRTMPARRRASARVTTRAGDRGDTSLFGKGRVRKTDPRVEALGDLDEAQAVLGIARAAAPRPLAKTLLDLQRGLYLAMGEVATPRPDLARLPERLDGAAVADLEKHGEELKRKRPIEGRFVVPGEDRLSAMLDHARTIVRRAERRVVECVDEGYFSGEDLLPWLNRLSDLLYVLARSVEQTARPARGSAGGARRARR